MTDERLVAIGTGVLALATFVLAALTWWNVRKTGKLVSATEKSAAAAAATVLEIQRDRELGHAPHIDWRAQTGQATDGTFVAGTAYVKNTGRGLAVHCLCCMRWLPDGALTAPITITTDLFDVQPDEEKNATMRKRSGMQLSDEMAGTESTERPVAAFCQDVLGNYYRFVPFKAIPDVHRPSIDKAEPTWMAFYRNQFNALAKY